MHYKLLGYTQNGSVRHFSFQRIEIGVKPVAFAVLADLTSARKFNLSLQELPSLCSRLLNNHSADQPSGVFHLTEADMNVCSAESSAAAEKERLARSRRGASATAARTPPIVVTSPGS